jgi:hypothetical protein
MSELNTTSINDLPTDPTGGGSMGGSMGGGNISLVTNETSSYKNQVIPQQTQGGQGQQGGQGMTLDQTTISQIVNGLQQASIAGATSLPSRDIPQNTQQLTHDPAVQANYVPPPPPSQKDYINDEPAAYDYPEERVKNALDRVYDDIQAPLLLSVLYFVFQLPIMRKMIFKYLPFFCNNDGNYSLNGLIFTSSMFGFIYFSLTKSIAQFNKF